MKKISVFIAAVFLLSLVCFRFPQSVSASSETPGGAGAKGYIVKLKSDRTSRMTLSNAGVQRIDEGIYTADSLEAAQSITEPDNIEYIEPNYYLTLYGFPYSGVPNDPRYDDQWWLKMIDAPGAWTSGMLGRGAKVAVIDSGLLTSHEDINYPSVLYKHNFIDNNSDITDQTGHGSFVTGIIASQIDNGKGISGISDEVGLVELKCFDSKTTTVDRIISAIAVARVQQCDVINMSFGMASDSTPLRDAINAAVSEGIIIVAAAGNDGNNILQYPAAYDNVIGVGSVDLDRSVSSFSQKNTSVFVTAPGNNIVSLNYSGNDKYAIGSGTSFSAPVVTAMAALAKSANGDIDTDDFKSLLISSSIDHGPAGYDTSYGYGIVNIRAFVGAMQSGYITYNNTDVVLVSVSGYPGEWDSGSQEFKVVIPAGFVPSPTPSVVEVITEDSGSAYTSETDDGGMTWTVTVTARDGETSRDYSIRLITSDNSAPIVLDDLHETGENAAAPASYDGNTNARAFAIDDISGWFSDSDVEDVLEYQAHALESTGIAVTSGTALTFVPAAADAGKTVTVKVKAYDGQFFSGAANVNIHVGALPASQSVLSTATARYDKYSGNSDYKDVAAGVFLYGNTLTAVRNGNETLLKNTDYGVTNGATVTDSSSVTVYRSYLDKLPKGESVLTFDFSAGDDAQLVLSIDDTAPLYSVTFMNNGVQYAAFSSVRGGSTITLPAGLARQGYDFMGWYTGENGSGTAFTAQTPVNSELILYAYWRTKQDLGGGGGVPGGGGAPGGAIPGGGFAGFIPPLPGAEFTITAEAATGGTVSGSGTAAQGAQAGLVIRPDNGFEISGVMIDGKPADIKSLINNDDGTWTLMLENITADHMIKVSFKAVVQQPVIEQKPIGTLFSDVNEAAWYKDSVRFVVEKELFKGTGAGQFSPQLHMTRSMFVSVLGRLSGTVDGDFPDMAFTDVNGKSWYAAYVSWASENGIVSGFGNGTFGPDEDVSREQMALFLYRYAKWKGLDIQAASISSENGSGFKDSASISTWALEAVEWAAGAGIVTGKPGNVFDPKGKATRAEVAAIIYRFVESAI